MKRISPALLAIAAAFAVGAPGSTGVNQGPSVNAPSPNVAPGDIPSNGNKVARMGEAIMGGRRRRRGRVTSSLNGRPDTGVARIKRAARKARNRQNNRRAHRA